MRIYAFIKINPLEVVMPLFFQNGGSFLEDKPLPLKNRETPYHQPIKKWFQGVLVKDCSVTLLFVEIGH